MIIELEVFSGQPNPKWEADDETATLIRDRLARVTVPVVAEQRDTLGYRGFQVVDEGFKWHVGFGLVMSSKGRFVDNVGIEDGLIEGIPDELSALREVIREARGCHRGHDDSSGSRFDTVPLDD